MLEKLDGELGLIKQIYNTEGSQQVGGDGTESKDLLNAKKTDLDVKNL